MMTRDNVCADIVFLDTETLGVDPDAPVWEFAAIRRFHNGRKDREDRSQFTIRHQRGHWLDELPARFRADYDARYRAADAVDPADAAVMVSMMTRGAHIVGAVPSFDTERLAKLLRHHGIEPGWHHHLVDVENLVVGYMARCAEGGSFHAGLMLPPPWDSNELSQFVGVDPADFARHTAMGDVEWVRAQWDAVTGGAW